MLVLEVFSSGHRKERKEIDFAEKGRKGRGQFWSKGRSNFIKFVDLERKNWICNCIVVGVMQLRTEIDFNNRFAIATPCTNGDARMNFVSLERLLSPRIIVNTDNTQKSVQRF